MRRLIRIIEVKEIGEFFRPLSILVRGQLLPLASLMFADGPAGESAACPTCLHERARRREEFGGKMEGFLGLLFRRLVALRGAVVSRKTRPIGDDGGIVADINHYGYEAAPPGWSGDVIFVRLVGPRLPLSVALGLDAFDDFHYFEGGGRSRVFEK